MITEKFESQTTQQADELLFDVEYIPGEIEELDFYKATHEKLGIVSYGDTPESAIESARMEAQALFMGDTSLMDKIKI